MDDFKASNSDISGTVKKINKAIENNRVVFTKGLDKVRKDLTTAEGRIKRVEVNLDATMLK